MRRGLHVYLPTFFSKISFHVNSMLNGFKIAEICMRNERNQGHEITFLVLIRVA